MHHFLRKTSLKCIPNTCSHLHFGLIAKVHCIEYLKGLQGGVYYYKNEDIIPVKCNLPALPACIVFSVKISEAYP